MVYESFGSSEIAWAGKTAPEIRDIAQKNGSVLLLPVGSTEQHGQHLPVSTDTILVDAVAQRGAEQVKETVPILKAPPIWSGHSPHHMSLGGTLSLKGTEIHDLIENVSDAALENGFDSLLLLNGHGGNASIITTVISSLGEQHPETQVVGLSYFHLAGSFIEDIRESEIGGMGHAGEFETSLMLYLRPELVQKDKMEGTKIDPVYECCSKDLFAGGMLSIYQEFEQYSESGALGDPSLATAAKGKQIYEGLGIELAKLLQKIHSKNT